MSQKDDDDDDGDRKGQGREESCIHKQTFIKALSS